MYRTAWRLGRRDLVVHRWRSLLIVLLVMLPVSAVVAGSVGVQGLTPTPAETVTRQLGATQAELSWLPRVDGERACPQWPTRMGNVQCDDGEQFTVRDVPAGLADAVPGYRAVPVAVGAVEVLRPLASGRSLPTRADATVVDVAAPEFAGRWDLTVGRSATGSEVVVSRPLARAFGLGVGDELATEQGGFTVAGIVAAPGLKGPAVYLPLGHPLAEQVSEEQLFVVGDQPISWEQVQSLNRHGVQVLSRGVILDPPFAPEDDADRLLALIGMVGALGGLMVMFVAGSAFAVGVRASRRQLGLLGAVGAPDAVLRRLVLFQAVLLGAAGALLGVGLGIGVGRLGSWWLAANDLASIWGFHIPWPAVGLTVLAGVLACVVAAWGPARTVTKVDALEAVRTAETATPRARVPWLGIVAAILGVAVMAGAVVAYLTDTSRPWWGMRPELTAAVIVGVVLLTAGVATSLHPVVALIARAVPRRPLPVRLAVRDVDRSRARVVPAVAAVVTATTLATMVVANVVGADEGMRARAAWRVHPTHVLIYLNDEAPDPGTAASAVEYTLGLPITASTLPALAGDLVTPQENTCTHSDGPPDPSDWRCTDQEWGAYPRIVVGDAPELAILLGREPHPDELADLRDGTLLTSSRSSIVNGHAEIISLDAAIGDGIEPAPGTHVPARLIAVDRAAGWSVMSPGRATQTGLPASHDTLVLETGRPLTRAENDDLNAVLRDLGFYAHQLPRDPSEARFSWGWPITALTALATLAIVGLVTALGATDARRDQATLAAIGAPSGLRRATTAGQVFVITFMGTLLGSAISVIGIIALTWTQPMHAGFGPVIPWPHLAAFVLGLPLAGALLTWLVMPPGKPTAQRLA